MNWLLDTDVICQPGKRQGDERVVAWLEREKNQCYTSAVVIAQLAYWVRTKEGRQRQALQAWLTRLVDAMQGRIFGFNVSVAHVWAEQERALKKAGERMPVGRQLHRRHSQTLWPHHCDWQRTRFPSPRREGLQSFQGTAEVMTNGPYGH